MSRTTACVYVACMRDSGLFYGKPAACRLTRLTATCIAVTSVYCPCGHGAKKRESYSACSDSTSR
jgi:hypothetical protein